MMQHVWPTVVHALTVVSFCLLVALVWGGLIWITFRWLIARLRMNFPEDNDNVQHSTIYAAYPAASAPTLHVVRVDHGTVNAVRNSAPIASDLRRNLQTYGCSMTTQLSEEDTKDVLDCISKALLIRLGVTTIILTREELKQAADIQAEFGINDETGELLFRVVFN